MSGLDFLFIFAGISLLIWVRSIVRIQQYNAQSGVYTSSRSSGQDNAVIEEIRALKEQVSAIQNTSHQFDIAFDEALTRIEHRVGRLEQQVNGRTSVEAETAVRSSLLG